MTAGVVDELVAPLDDPSFYAGDPFPTYRRLRAEAPIARHERGRFWVISRHEDVVRISRDPETFCSAQGVLIMDIDRDLPDIPGALLYVDPPEHARYRKLVNPSFAGSRVRALEDDLRTLARRVLDGVEAGTEVDLVDDVAVPYPLFVIADLLGVPKEDYPKFHEWSDAMIAGGSEQSDDTLAKLTELSSYLMAIIDERRRSPRDDLVSGLLAATIDGAQLNDGELMMFLIQLLVAGNETTRNLLSNGLIALADRPDEWRRLTADRALLPTAIEELLRWTSPVISFLRTATRDVTVGGIEIAAGDHLLLLYASANRDEAVFGDSSETLDIGRDPNHHVAFGFGEHFCLGAALARLETRVFLEELFDRFTTIESVGPIERLRSTVIGGVLHAPVVFGTS